MPTTRRNYGNGTCLVSSHPWGFFVSGRAECPDGSTRALKRIAQTADTFFSVPASVSYRGKTVSGYVTFATASGSSVETEDDPLIVRFIPVRYGKNGSAFDRTADA